VKPTLALVETPIEAREPLTIEAAFRRYSSYVAAIAIRLLGRDDEVDDVVQDVFLAAQRGRGKLRDPNAIKQWLATVTVRIARRRLRLRRLRTWLGFDKNEGYEDLAAPGATPDDRALLSCVYAVLDELPVAERIAWTLRNVEGERLDNVARLCGCSLATAKRRIAAAQATLERMLADE
jgi:RNA polymerase sigma-70 factor (ECF subfamily)